MQAAESDNSAAAWTFSQCLDYAYSNNISLQRLVLDNQSDDATLEQSKAQWQPTLGFSTTQGQLRLAVGKPDSQCLFRLLRTQRLVDSV